MKTQTQPTDLCKGQILTNRRGCHVYVKAAGAKTVTIATRPERHAQADRMPRALVDRWISCGKWAVTGLADFV